MFESLRESFRQALSGARNSDDRRALLAQMRATLVQARHGVSDLEDGVAATYRRLEKERADLATVRRRKDLASGIGDAETVGVAARFETMHSERVAVLERKLEAQELELHLAKSEVEDMTRELRAAAAGVGSTAPPPQETVDEGEQLERELDALHRSRTRAAAEAAAEERLAALKRRMGK